MRERAWRRIKDYAPRLTLGTLLLVAGCTPGARPKVEATAKAGSTTISKNSRGLISPLQGSGYYLRGPFDDTPGPHNSNLDRHGPRNGIDVATAEVVGCPVATEDNLASLPLITVQSQKAVAPVSGEIVTVGNEKNRKDPDHSKVEIQTNGGLRVGLMHLANFTGAVTVGSKVEAGTVLGEISCESPYKGYTTGAHTMMYFLDDVGKPFEIVGHTIGGYIINPDGTMTDPQGEVITPSSYRCPASNPCEEGGRKIVNEIKGDRGGVVLTPTPEVKGPVLAAPLPEPRPTVEQSVQIGAATVVPSPTPSLRPTIVPTAAEPTVSLTQKLESKMTVNQLIAVLSAEDWINSWRRAYTDLQSFHCIGPGIYQPNTCYFEYLLHPEVIRLGNQEVTVGFSEDQLRHFINRLVINDLDDSERTMSVSWRSQRKLLRGYEFLEALSVRGLFEMRNLQVTATPDEITEVDKANEVRWKGNVNFRYIWRFQANTRVAGDLIYPPVPDPGRGFSEWQGPYAQKFFYRFPNPKNVPPSRAAIYPGIVGWGGGRRDGTEPILPGCPEILQQPIIGKEKLCRIP